MKLSVSAKYNIRDSVYYIDEFTWNVPIAKYVGKNKNPFKICRINFYVTLNNNGDEVVSIAYDLLADTYNEFVITNVREDLIYTDWQECYNYCSKLQDERIPF